MSGRAGHLESVVVRKMKNNFSEDVSEFLSVLENHDVHYVVVGGEAVIYYGHARLTGDIDIFYEISAQNVERLYAALNEFWAYDIPGVENEKELSQKGMIFQFGVPPNRIDLINEIESVTFAEAWNGKVEEKFSFRGKTVSIYYIGPNELIKNKNAAGRPKDLEDLKFLKRTRRK